MKRSKIYIVDDHSVVRLGIAQVIYKEKDMVVCGEAEKVSLAKAEIVENKPDIVLVDISMNGDRGGVELIKFLSKSKPPYPVLVVSMHDELTHIRSAMQAGAKGYFYKQDAVSNLPTAIRKVLKGHSYFSDSISDKITSLIADPQEIIDPPSVLNKREKEIFHLLGEGKRRYQVAEQLFISAKTVSTHVEAIKKKLGFSTASELAQYAIKYMQNNTDL